MVASPRMVESVEQPAGERQAIAERVGTVLGERYQLDRVLGAGGMGAVFEGRDLRLGRAVALKVMLPGYARDAEYVKRFLREAQTASMIRHRNVVVLLDFGEAEDGLVYSVMERLRGQDLEEFLKGQPGQRVSWEQACGLLVQIANGLRAAHSEGVIHRDVKPANCFLTTEDDEVVVKVVDFGIAKLGEGMQTQQLTGTGNVLGTPSYTAPEMVLTGGPASPRSDVYSLGVVAYRMLAGRLPFTGKTGFEVMHHACIKPVPRFREAGVEVPEAVEALVLEMLSKEPEERPADMGEVRQRLVALGREAGGVSAAVEGIGSSSLRIELGGAEASGGSGSSRSGEVTRTEVLDSGNRAAEESGSPSGRTQVASAGGATPAGTAVPAPDVPGPTDEAERTDVMIGPGFREPSERRLAAPVVATEVERTAVLDSGLVERPQRKAMGWLLGGGVLVALMAGGVAWMMSATEPRPEAARSPAIPSSATKADDVEPPPVVAEPRPVAKSTVEPSELAVPAEPEPAVVPPTAEEVESVEPAKSTTGESPSVQPIEEPKADPSEGQPPRPKAPRVPSDAEMKKRLARKIESACAAKIEGKSVKVSFIVTSAGTPSLMTATPRDAAGECAKQQIAGAKLRPRKKDTPMQIVVE